MYQWREDNLRRRRMTESYAISGIVVVFSAMMFLLYHSQAYMADRAKCSQNMRLLTQAMSLYAIDYDGEYPPQNGWAKNLMPYVDNLSAYYCPSDEGNSRSRKEKKRVGDIDTVVSYWYRAKPEQPMDDAHAILFGDKMLPNFHGNHSDGGNIGYYDGHVHWWSSREWKDNKFPVQK